MTTHYSQEHTMCKAERDGWLCTMPEHGPEFPHVATSRGGELICCAWWSDGTWCELNRNFKPIGVVS